MPAVTDTHREQFASQGFALVRGLFSPEEAARYRERYTAMREEGNVPGDKHIADPAVNDPLLRYPRLMQPHRWDDESRQWLLDARINAGLTALLGREPYAVQTMVYFKPPGARGQALHQDNYYLRVQPGTCVAAWMALDACDEANGCLQVVPGSHTWPILCTEKADTTQSFTDVVVPLPPGVSAVPVLMEPGDVLFFNGQLVHGSFPNTTPDRFRRSLIGHYIEGDSQKVASWYFPALRMDGTQIGLESSGKGTACGVWVDREGVALAEVSGFEMVEKATE
jgi:ectoine hydroxylase-related dioxygenase (phytanoyl-CoA dioxygenase family)